MREVSLSVDPFEAAEDSVSPQLAARIVSEPCHIIPSVLLHPPSFAFEIGASYGAMSRRTGFAA
jgi:hypothetical protein